MKKIYEFKILHAGWEMDNNGWITENDFGLLDMHTTNHGSDEVMSKDYLFSKIDETEKSLFGLLKAKELMGYEE